MRLDEEQPAAPYHIPLHPKASAPPLPPSGIQGLRVRTGCFFQALVDTPQWQRAKSGNQASLLRNRFFSGGEKKDGGLSSASSRAIENEGHFPFNAVLVQVPCSPAAQKIHGPLPVTQGSDAPSKCSPWSNSHPVSREWQIPGPHARTSASESLGWGTP